MNRGKIIIVAGFIFLLSTAFAMAADHGHKASGTDHSGHGGSGTDHSGSAGSGTDHSEHMGKLIHETRVNGHRFAYHLMELKQGPNSHHLMVYVTDPQGKAVENGKTGYLIEGPGGSKQKAMAMDMPPGYSADVNFKEKGSYTIKTKVAIGDKSLLDSFTYKVE